MRVTALGEQLVEQRQVVDAGQVDGFEQPDLLGVGADPASEAAIGSGVNVRFSKLAAMTSSPGR